MGGYPASYYSFDRNEEAMILVIINWRLLVGARVRGQLLVQDWAAYVCSYNYQYEVVPFGNCLPK